MLACYDTFGHVEQKCCGPVLRTVERTAFLEWKSCGPFLKTHDLAFSDHNSSLKLQYAPDWPVRCVFNLRVATFVSNISFFVSNIGFFLIYAHI